MGPPRPTVILSQHSNLQHWKYSLLLKQKICWVSHWAAFQFLSTEGSRLIEFVSNPHPLSFICFFHRPIQFSIYFTLFFNPENSHRFRFIFTPFITLQPAIPVSFAPSFPLFFSLHEFTSFPFHLPPSQPPVSPFHAFLPKPTIFFVSFLPPSVSGGPASVATAAATCVPTPAAAWVPAAVTCGARTAAARGRACSNSGGNKDPAYRKMKAGSLLTREKRREMLRFVFRMPKICIVHQREGEFYFEILRRKNDIYEKDDWKCVIGWVSYC